MSEDRGTNVLDSSQHPRSPQPLSVPELLTPMQPGEMDRYYANVRSTAVPRPPSRLSWLEHRLQWLCDEFSSYRTHICCPHNTSIGGMMPCIVGLAHAVGRKGSC